jgi:hypothetical protein
MQQMVAREGGGRQCPGSYDVGEKRLDADVHQMTQRETELLPGDSGDKEDIWIP